MGQSQDDSIVGTKQCRHSVAIMPIPGSLSSSSPDLLQPASSVLDFSNPAGEEGGGRGGGREGGGEEGILNPQSPPLMAKGTFIFFFFLFKAKC